MRDLDKKFNDELNNLRDYQSFDVDAEWRKFADKNIVEQAPQVTKGRRISLWPISIAASLVLLIGAGVFMWNSDKAYVPTAYTAADQAQSITLDDETIVSLQPYSTLTVNTDLLTSKERRVVLEGVATFDVTSDKNKPFIVETDEAAITVLGTIFEVNSIVEGTSVTLNEGSVNLASLQDPTISMTMVEGDSYNLSTSGEFKTLVEEPVVVEPSEENPVIAEENEVLPVVTSEPVTKEEVIIETPIEKEITEAEEVSEEPKLNISKYTFESLLTQLKRAHGDRVSTKRRMDCDKDGVVSIDPHMDLDDLMELLKEQTDIEWTSEKCDGCYHITKFKKF